MARTVVTKDMITQMNELYLEIGTYAGVSRALGGTPSASTVKKYIIPNYVSQKNLVHTVVDQIGDEKEAVAALEKLKNCLEVVCRLSDEERERIADLWNEIPV